MTHLLLLRPKINIFYAQPNPPIGLGYLAGILRSHGHKVDLLDCANLKDSYPKIRSRIETMQPDAIGITALSAYYKDMRILARYLRKLNIPIILGGVHVSALPELSLRDCRADFAVVGEGELTTLDLMDKWQDESARKQINGLVYLEAGQFKCNPPRELIRNLDEIPFPAWDLINPLKYPPHPHGSIMKRSPVAPILTTRGCPSACTYCTSTQFWGRKFRRRSAKNIVDEIAYLVNTFKIREIHIWDDNFTLIRKHVVEFCREILQRRLDLTFNCPNGIRVDTLDRDLLILMKRAGFYTLCFSIESGSQRILQRANKRIDLKVIPKMVKIAKDLGYYIPATFMFGLPGETYTTARQSIQFAKDLPLDTVSFFIANQLPGSKLFDDWLRENGLDKVKSDIFNFYRPTTELIYTNGSKKLRLPRDAYREFTFRPKQFIKSLTHLNLYSRKVMIDLIRRSLKLVS